jgi:antitoxin CcdA
LSVNASLPVTGLEHALARKRAERWLKENAAALGSYNVYVEKNGLPLEKLRLF